MGGKYGDWRERNAAWLSLNAAEGEETSGKVECGLCV